MIRLKQIGGIVVNLDKVIDYKFSQRVSMSNQNLFNPMEIQNRLYIEIPFKDLIEFNDMDSGIRESFNNNNTCIDTIPSQMDINEEGVATIVFDSATDDFLERYCTINAETGQIELASDMEFETKDEALLFYKLKS